jgi:hypothetical protein
MDVATMKIAMNYRNWGPYATRENLFACAHVADQSSLDSIWVNDHIGLPKAGWDNPFGIPQEMGNIVDPFAVMAFLGARVTHLVHTQAYDTPAQYQEIVDIVCAEIRPAVQ